jgi:hypothetical protein
VISNHSQLRDAVMDCDRHTIKEFLLVESFVYSPEMKMLEDFRNKAAFHYDRFLPIENLNKIKGELPDHPFAYSMGHDGLDWHYELGDMVMIVCLYGTFSSKTKTIQSRRSVGKRSRKLLCGSRK